MSVPTFLPMIALLIALILLGLAAAEWGVDSRSPLSDDHNR